MSAAEGRTLVLDVDAASIRTGAFNGAVAFRGDTLALRHLVSLRHRNAARPPQA